MCRAAASAPHGQECILPSPPWASQTHSNHCVQGETLGNLGKRVGLVPGTHLMFLPLDNYNQHRMGVCELYGLPEMSLGGDLLKTQVCLFVCLF